MDGLIQEDDIRLTSNYSYKYREELLSLLQQKTNEYNVTKRALEDKVIKENEDIDVLNDKYDLCFTMIDKNTSRLNKIPDIIRGLENEIESDESYIENASLPIYSSYRDFDGYWREYVDHEATEREIRYLDRLKDEIKEDKEEIERLNREIERRNTYISILKEMAVDIKGTIEEKRNLIKSLNVESKNLSECMNSYMNFISQSTTKLSELVSNLNYAAQLINSFGMTVGKTNFLAVSNHYSSNLAFVATANAIEQEINLLKTASTTNKSYDNELMKINSSFLMHVSSDVTDQAINDLNASIKNLDKYCDSLDSNMMNLKKANEFLIRYEQINF